MTRTRVTSPLSSIPFLLSSLLLLVSFPSAIGDGCSTPPNGSSYSISPSWNLPASTGYLPLACLSVSNDRQIRRQEVACSGIPIPVGILADVDLGRLAVVGGGGNTRIPAQFNVLSRWGRPPNDASADIRWIETSLPINIGPDETSTFELRLYSTDVSLATSQPDPTQTHDLSVTSISGGRYRVDTGTAEFTLDPNDPSLLTHAWARHPSTDSLAQVIRPSASVNGPHVTFRPMDSGRFGTEFRTLDPSDASVTYFELVQEGPVKATFMIEGRWRSGDLAKCVSDSVSAYDALTFTVALTFFRGRRDVKVQFHANQLCSDADGSDWTDQGMILDRAAYSLDCSPMVPSSSGGANVYYGGRADDAVVGPVSQVGGTTTVSVSQDRGGGSPWTRRARTRRDSTVLNSATTYDAPVVAVEGTVSSSSFVASVTLGHMRYREPQTLSASSGGRVLSIDVIGAQQRVGEGKGIWSIGMLLLSPTDGTASDAASAVEASRLPAVYECERGLLVHVPADALFDSGAYPPLGYPGAPPSTIRTRYIDMMQKLHHDTVNPGGQWDRAKRFGSQLWPDVEFDGWQVDGANNPNQSDPSMGYWNAHAHELVEYLRTGDPMWAHDFALPQTYLQLFTAYLNVGWETHDWSRSGLAVNSGGSGDGDWHRSDFGSDDYMYDLAVKTAYVVRPDATLRRRIEVAGRTVRNRYDVSIPEDDRDQWVERLDVSRGVIQHMEIAMSCAEFGKGSHGSLTHNWLMDVMQEFVQDNLSTGTICQPDKVVGRNCGQPQTFMQVSMLYEFFVRVYLNYGDLYGGLHKAVVTIPKNLYQFGIQKQDDGSIVYRGNHAALLDCTTNSARTNIQSCTKQNNGDGVNIYDHNINSLMSALLVADSFDPSLGYCDIVGDVWTNGNQITNTWLSVDFNDAGWTKPTSQMMSLIAYGVGWLEFCQNPNRTTQPSSQTNTNPTDSPTLQPIDSPTTTQPTNGPTKRPTASPNLAPTSPTQRPMALTLNPTPSPSKLQTKAPTPQGSLTLLKTSMDGIAAIESPEVGSGGQTTLNTADFILGKTNKGARFNTDAGGKYVRFPVKDNIDLSKGSITMWYRPNYDADADDVEHMLLCVGDVYNPPHFLIKEGDRLHFYAMDASWDIFGVFSEYRAPLWNSHKWVFIKVSWDTSDANDSFRIFVDNKRVDTGGANGGWNIKNALNAGDMYIGSGNEQGHFNAQGIIDELSINSGEEEEECKDDESFRFNNKKRLTCNKLMKKNLKKCKKWDKEGRRVRNHCPQKCEYCSSRRRCRDDKNAFKVGVTKYKCKNYATSVSRCNEKDKKNRLVKEMCRKSCNFCD